jgi:hypothetical protein
MKPAHQFRRPDPAADPRLIPFYSALGELLATATTREMDQGKRIPAQPRRPVFKRR